jgi:hypothetical protein
MMTYPPTPSLWRLALGLLLMLVSVAPRARDAYRVNDLRPDTAFGASIRSDQDVIVERTM